MPTDTYSIVDLARLTGVNVRTIRYYLAQGLLPASGESGPGSHYGEGHLDRLRLTKRLQQQHLPLSEIRRRLAELTDDQVASVLSTTQEPDQSPTTSALDYVRSVLGTGSVAPPPPPAPSAPAAPSRSVDAAKFIVSARRAMPTPPPPLASVAEAGPIGSAEPATPAAPAVSAAPAAKPEPMTTEPAAPERSQWERLSLGPNIELHIRRPLSRLEQRRVERLITIARQVLKEETP